MNLKNKINKALALGLIISSVFMSTKTVNAISEDVHKEMTKLDSKTELNIDRDEDIKMIKKEIVTANVLNIREEASKESQKVGALTKNTVVTVLETNGEWSKIKLSDEKEAWINNEYTSNEKAKVNVEELNLRKEPSTEKEKLEVLKRNTELEVMGVLEIENKEDNTTNKWYEVKVIEKDKDDLDSEDEKNEAKEEKTGFVFANYALTESEEVKLIEEARKNAEAKNTVQLNSKVSNVTLNNSGSDEIKDTAKEDTTSSSISGRTITVNASAYSGHSITATGTVPKWGTIAVDPSVIPYGTKVYIPMYDKVFIAEDCGGAIKGNKIDIFMNSAQETRNFGRRNIEIKILG